jgi:hypothetical protein
MVRKDAVDEEVVLRDGKMRELSSKYGSGDEAFRRAYDESGYDAFVVEQNDLFEEGERISEQMRAIRPKTFAGVAALAYALKVHGAPGYWDEAEDDRDWQEFCVTQFIDRLIELGMPSATALA